MLWETGAVLRDPGRCLGVPGLYWGDRGGAWGYCRGPEGSGAVLVRYWGCTEGTRAALRDLLAALRPVSAVMAAGARRQRRPRRAAGAGGGSGSSSSSGGGDGGDVRRG